MQACCLNILFFLLESGYLNNYSCSSKTATLTAGGKGPVLLQDYVFLDEMAHFDRERIPERVVHTC